VASLQELTDKNASLSKSLRDDLNAGSRHADGAPEAERMHLHAALTRIESEKAQISGELHKAKTWLCI